MSDGICVATVIRHLVAATKIGQRELMEGLFGFIDPSYQVSDALASYLVNRKRDVRGSTKTLAARIPEDGFACPIG